MNQESLLNLFKSQLICEKVLSYLDAKSIAYLSSCCLKLRKLTNSNLTWHRLCKIHEYEKYEYLLNFASHPLIPSKSTSISPIFNYSQDSGLEELCHWRSIFNRSEHLLRNWRNGIYFVFPVIKAHKGQVSAFDSNGKIVVSGCSDDKFIKVWSINELECICTIKFKNDTINCLKIYNEDIIVAGDEGLIKIYDQNEGDLKQVLSNNYLTGGSVNKLLVTNDKLVASFNDRSIRVWSLKTYEILEILRGHEDEIECLGACENFLISGSWDKNVILWDLNKRNKLISLVGHGEVVNCVKMKGNKVISASSDSNLIIWNLQIEQRIRADGTKDEKLKAKLIDFKVLMGHSSDIYEFDIYENYIASGGADSLVLIWNFNGDLLFKLKGHLGIVRCVRLDEHKLVTGGDAKKLIVWDYRNGKQLNVIHRNPVKLSSMWLNDTMIVTASPELEMNMTIICYW